MNRTFNISCIAYRRIPLCEENKPNDLIIERHIILVDISKLPTSFPKETNPRDIKLTTSVAKQIERSLNDNDLFHVLNRGILISAKYIKWANKTKTITIDFGSSVDSDLYGVVDGGHTYQIIQNFIKGNSSFHGKRYVSIEIFTGIGNSNQQSISIADFASARNNSVPVDQKSLAELEHKFELIKKSIQGQPYASKIGYRQNSSSEVDIREIIALMTVFDAEKYKPTDIENQPVKAYSQKESCLKDYLNQIEDEKIYGNSYKKLSSVLPQILELSDHIRHHVPDVWNKELGGKIGSKLDTVCLKEGKDQYHFVSSLNKYKEKVFDTQDKTWLWLPILASLRTLVDYKDGKAFFRIEPLKFYKEHAKSLVSILYQNCKNNFAPHRIGKDRAMWRSLIQTPVRGLIH